MNKNIEDIVGAILNKVQPSELSGGYIHIWCGDNNEIYMGEAPDDAPRYLVWVQYTAVRTFGKYPNTKTSVGNKEEVVAGFDDYDKVYNFAKRLESAFKIANKNKDIKIQMME